MNKGAEEPGQVFCWEERGNPNIPHPTPPSCTPKLLLPPSGSPRSKTTQKGAHVTPKSLNPKVGGQEWGGGITAGPRIGAVGTLPGHPSGWVWGVTRDTGDGTERGEGQGTGAQGEDRGQVGTGEPGGDRGTGGWEGSALRGVAGVGVKKLGADTHRETLTPTPGLSPPFVPPLRDVTSRLPGQVTGNRPGWNSLSWIT